MGSISASARVALALALAATPYAQAQYPGKIAKSDRGQPVLRSVAVLEWTGDPGKPSASRLVPVAVYDGEHLNDGTIYMNRPEPLALENGVEYELQKDGKPEGIFDVFGSSDLRGAWDGFGVWKPLTAATQKAASAAINTSALYAPIPGAEDDKPVLKRKHPKGTDSDPDPNAKSPAGSTSSSGAGIGSSPAGSGSSSSGSGASKTSAASPASEVDPDRPTLKRKSSGDTDTSSAASASPAQTSASSSPSPAAPAPARDADPDRPTLHRSHKDVSLDMPSSVPPDPDRPRLKHGKPSDVGPEQSPGLLGYPPSMQQAVAVSDALNHAEHPWKYTWADPADELKMKASLEEIARKELGLDTPPPAPAKPAKKTVPARKISMLPPPQPPAPAPLADERFRVFELTYGGSATMVLTASTPAPAAPQDPGSNDSSAHNPTAGPTGQPQSLDTPVLRRGKPASQPTPAAGNPAPSKNASKAASKPAPAPKPSPQKYITLIAQPDLYGGVLVIYKSVTDAAHLDEKPRLRLIDAVDAMGDNRGELLFELRGDQQRQFALFRVLRGSAQQLFATVAIP